MKKKLLTATIAAFVLSLTLAGCGETAAKGNSTESKPEPTAIAAESSTEASTEAPSEDPTPTAEPKVDARPLLDGIIEQYKTMYDNSGANLSATANQLKEDIYPTFAKFEAGQDTFNAWVSSIDSDIAQLRTDSIDLMIQYLELMKEHHAGDTTELTTDNVNFCEQFLNETRLPYFDALDAMVNDYYTDYINNEVPLLFNDEEAFATYGSFLEYEPHFTAINATYTQTLDDLAARVFAARNDDVLTSAYAMMHDLFFDGDNSVAIIDNVIEYLKSNQ